MSFAVEKWLELLVEKVLDTFNDRVKFIGLQGSYRRGEATDASDIDVVIILNRLDQEDLRQYKQIIQSMPQSEKACGFISGQKEIYNWPKFESFQLYHDTKALYGDLRRLLKPFDRKDVIESIQIGASTLYHETVNNYLFGGAEFQHLKKLYKSAFFLLQSVYFLKTQKYFSTKQELIQHLEGEDKKILEIGMDLEELTEKGTENTDYYFEKLMEWSSEKIESTAYHRPHTPRRLSSAPRQYFQKRVK